MENYIYIYTQPSCTVQRPSTCFVKTGDVEDSKKLKDQDWMIERDLPFPLLAMIILQNIPTY